MVERFPFLADVYFGNSVSAYLQAAGIFVAAQLALYLVNILFLRRLRQWTAKSETRVDDFIFHLIEKMIIPVLYVASFFIASQRLTLSAGVEKGILIFVLAVVVFQSARLINAIAVKIMSEVWLKSVDPGRGGSMAAKTMMTFVKVLIWGIAGVFVLDNLGFDISAVVAGLGIGGIAVALAAQTVLGDLFNYFVIFFDKPFEEGDFIIQGDYLGTIEHVGIKSTRIRSLGGEQIVFSNSDLTSSRVRNYKRMHMRRILFRLGVTYQTTKAQLEKIPGIIKAIIEATEQTRFDRAHFSAYGDFSLTIEVVYYVQSGDYNLYMDVQQKINLAIKAAFEKEGIEFAYPTQTLFVGQEPGASFLTQTNP